MRVKMDRGKIASVLRTSDRRQKDICEACGVSRSTMAAVMRGDNVNYSSAVLIASGIGLPVDELLDDQA